MLVVVVAVGNSRARLYRSDEVEIKISQRMAALIKRNKNKVFLKIGVVSAFDSLFGIELAKL